MKKNQDDRIRKDEEDIIATRESTYVTTDGDGEEFTLEKETKNKKNEYTGTTPTLVSGVLKAAVYLTTVIIISIFLGIGIILVGNDVFALVKDDSVIELEIPEGSTVESIADLLAENDIIKYPSVFKLYAAFKNVEDSSFVAGKYSISPSMNYDILCSAFKPVLTRQIVRVTIPEGSSVNDIINIFTSKGIGTRQGFIDAINKFDYSEYFDFVKEIYEVSSMDRFYKLEGYLYPDTYDVYSDAKESQIIYKLLDNFDKKFSKEMRADAAEAGFTIDEIIIIASLIQKECYHYEDYDKVSSVFINRINNSKQYPKLESDATVAYAIELITGKRPDFIGEEELGFNNPYNTRMYNGMPPGAIANPGYNAIMCAIYPEITSYYYFVTDTDGYNVFSKTYSEHKKAVQAILDKQKENN